MEPQQFNPQQTPTPEQPIAPTPQPLPQMPPPEQQSPQPVVGSGKPKRDKEKFLIWGLVVLLVIFVGVGTYLYLHQSDAKNSIQAAAKQPPAVTLYYNDGKTVLYDDPAPTSEPTTKPDKAPYFVDVARNELETRFGKKYYEQGAWKVTTSLDATLQANAEKLVADNQANLQKLTRGLADNQAVVLQDVTNGQLKALVGGVDYANPEYGPTNFATQKVALGGNMKPFDYTALIEQTTAYGAGSAVEDTQGPLEGYPCTKVAVNQGDETNCLLNYDRKTPGTMPLRYALGGQRNIPAAKAAQTVGMQKVIDMANSASSPKAVNCYAYNDVDYTKPGKCYLSASQGDGIYASLTDQVHAFSTLTNMGKRTAQTTIQSITLNGQTKSNDQSAKQVIKPDTAFIINDILSDPKASYLPGSCTDTSCTPSYKFHRFNSWKFTVNVATNNFGFSGTTTSWSAKYAVISLVGNHTLNQNIQQYGAQVENLTTPLTRGLMEAAHKDLPAANWAKPAGVKTAPAFLLDHKISAIGEEVPSSATDIYPAWYKN